MAGASVTDNIVSKRIPFQCPRAELVVQNAKRGLGSVTGLWLDRHKLENLTPSG